MSEGRTGTIPRRCSVSATRAPRLLVCGAPTPSPARRPTSRAPAVPARRSPSNGAHRLGPRSRLRTQRGRPPGSRVRATRAARLGSWTRSTARRSGPMTQAASHASSSTPATGIRPGRPPRPGSARSSAARHALLRLGNGGRDRGPARPGAAGHDDRARRGRLLRHLGADFGSLEPWGLGFVEYDQTAAPPDGAGIVWVEAPANPVLTEPDWEALQAHPRPRRLRRDGLDAGLPARTRPRRRRRRPFGDEVPDREPRRAARRGRHRDAERVEALRGVRTRTGMIASPHAAGSLLLGLDSLTRRMHRISETAAELARRPRRASCGRGRPLPRLLGADLVRRRRPAERSRRGRR